MVFSVAAATARRRIVVMAKQTQFGQKRSMGGGGPAPEWEGIDKVVRGVFPHDHQLAMAIMGGYSGLLVLFKIKSAFSKKEEPAPSSVAGDASGEGMPAIDSPEFGKFLETERFTKMLESDDFGHIIEGTKA